MLSVLGMLALVQGPLAPASPVRLRESPATLQVTLGADVALTFSREPFGVRSAYLAGVELAATRPAPEYRLSGARPKIEVEASRVVDTHVELDLRFGEETLESTAHETLRRIELQGGVGYVRTVRWGRPKGCFEFLDDPTFTVEPLGFVATRWEVDLACYGSSTVSDPGITYTLQHATVADGARIWIFRMGISAMSQIGNGHIPIEHTEAVLLAPSDAKLAAVDLVLQLVHHPYDRRDFVRKLSKEWYHKLYETPVVRHLDPARTDADGEGTEEDPWPSYERCIEARLIWVMAPGSRLVLHTGEHGLLGYLPDGVSWEAAPGERPVFEGRETPVRR